MPLEFSTADVWPTHMYRYSRALNVLTLRNLRLLWFTSSVSFFSSCNFVLLRQNRLESQLTKVGLQKRTLTNSTISMSYWEGGTASSKPPVLLVHGFGASGLWQWTELASELARDRRVIIPDLLWFGDSAPSRRDFQIDTQVDAVSALLDSMQLRQVDVVGVSYGGIVGHELSAAQPERVRKLILVDTPARFYSQADLDGLLKRLKTNHLSKILVPEEPAGIKVLLDACYEDPPWVPDFALRQTFDLLYSKHRTEQTALLDTAIAELAHLSSRPGQSTAPTRVIWGENDPLFPLDVGRKVAESLKAELVVIPKTRHMPVLEKPAEFNRHVREFLDDVRN